MVKAILMSAYCVGAVVALVGAVMQSRARKSQPFWQMSVAPALIRWSHESRPLPHSTKRALARANRRGVAASPDLADLAARRAEAMIAGLDHAARPSPERTARVVSTLGWNMFAVGSLALWNPSGLWFRALVALVAVSLIGQVTSWIRRPARRRRLVQSLERNRALLDEGPVPASSWVLRWSP